MKLPTGTPIKTLLSALVAIALAASAHAQGPLTNGGSHDGSISVIGETDTWTIHADEGKTLRIQAAKISGTNFEPLLRLYAPGGAEVASDSGSNSTGVSHVAAVSGSYTVELLDASTIPNGTGDYRLFAAVPGSPFIVPAGDEGGEISSGQMLAGTIELADMDLYSFEASAGQAIRLGVGETTATSFQPFLLLYGPDGGLITSNGGSISTDVAATASVAGTYTVVVQDWNNDVSGSGDYQLYLSVLGRPFSVPSGDEGGTIASGEVRSGTISLGDMDLYSFEASAGQAIRLGVGETTATSFQPFLLLYGPDGGLITSNGGSISTDVVATASVAGTYTVVLQDWNNDVSGSGDYQLYLAVLGRPFSVPSGDEGGTIASGEVRAGTIALGDMDLYSFEASAGQAIRLGVGETTATSFQPFLLLYGPDGGLITSNGGSISTGVVATASVAGTYTVVVQDWNNDVSGSGDYQLYLAVLGRPFTVPSGDEGGTISSGESRSGTIALGDMDLYSFDVSAGHEIQLAVGETTATGFQPFLLLYGPDGGLITSNGGSISTDVVATASVAGTYTAVVQDWSTDVIGSGDYELDFTLTPGGSTVPGGGSSGTITNGGFVDGTVGVLGDIDKWSFTATAGEEIFVQAARTAGTTSFTPRLRVYAPGGSLIAQDSGGSTAAVRFTAVAGGTYTAVFDEAGADAIGDYRIFLARTATSFVVPAGDEGGTLENGLNEEADITLGDLDLWNFEAQIGETIHLQTGRTDGSTSFNPQMLVYGPDGELAATSSGSSTTHIVFEATQNGTHTVVVRETSTDNPGSYRLHFARIPLAYAVTSSDEGGTLDNGLNEEADITLGDLDLWDFTAQVGETIHLQTGRTGGSTSFNPQTLVYGPDGELVATSSGSASTSIVFEATQNGTHTVVVRETGTDNSGSYRLHFARIPLPYAVASGDEGGGFESGASLDGSLTLGDLDLWSFHAFEGDAIMLELARVTGSTSFNPNLVVYGPDGEVVIVASGSASASAVFTVLQDGYYTVVVRETDSDASGTYSLTATGMTARPTETTLSTPSPGFLRIAWPSPSNGWELEESSTLLPASWSPSAAPFDDGYEKSITIDTSEFTKRFFRLRKP